MKECCKSFFKANELQNILNEPLQCCGYCGRKLTDKEFAKILKRGVVTVYQKTVMEKVNARNKLRGKYG